jgi:hypothetical protein
MRRPNIWFVERVVSLVAGVYVFSQAIHIHTNFDPLAGLATGVAFFLLAVFVVSKPSVAVENIFRLTSPCWPAGKYPQTYWFSFGVTVVVSAVVNLIFHLDNPAAVRLYMSLLLWGVGILAGALVGHYKTRKRDLKSEMKNRM